MPSGSARKRSRFSKGKVNKGAYPTSGTVTPESGSRRYSSGRSRWIKLGSRPRPSQRNPMQTEQTLEHLQRQVRQLRLLAIFNAAAARSAVLSAFLLPRARGQE